MPEVKVFVTKTVGKFGGHTRQLKFFSAEQPKLFHTM